MQLSREGFCFIFYSSRAQPFTAAAISCPWPSTDGAVVLHLPHPRAWHVKSVDMNSELEHHQMIEFTDKNTLTSKSTETLDYITKTSPACLLLSCQDMSTVCLCVCVCVCVRAEKMTGCVLCFKKVLLGNLKMSSCIRSQFLHMSSEFLSNFSVCIQDRNV